MRARFIGGTEDGKTHFVDRGARYYLVPVPPKPGSIEEFLDLDYKPKYQVQRYRRTAFDRETHTVTYTFEEIE